MILLWCPKPSPRRHSSPHLFWLSRLLKHGKSSFILAIHKANIVAHAADDQSSNTVLCGQSWAIWVAQHSLATWPEWILEPLSFSGSTLLPHFSTTLIWRNLWTMRWRIFSSVISRMHFEPLHHWLFLLQKSAILYSFLFKHHQQAMTGVYLAVFHVRGGSRWAIAEASEMEFPCPIVLKRTVRHTRCRGLWKAHTVAVISGFGGFCVKETGR